QVRNVITVATDGGTLQTVTLSDASDVRFLDRAVTSRIGAYGRLLAETQSADSRQVTIVTEGTGTRDIVVGHISEVPIWKSTYRIAIGGESEPAIQGWAIVDNTTGEDWTNIDLSLVAGAPQSFIAALSQPQYGRRPVVNRTQNIPPPQIH